MMFGFPQQNNNDGSDEIHDYTRLDNELWQNLDDALLVDVATQVPPMLLAEQTQHHQTIQYHQTLPHHLNQIVKPLVELSSHPLEVQVHNGGGSMMQHAGSSVRPKKRRREPWTEEEHKLFLDGLENYKGQWKIISKYFVKTKSSTQIASHAQKYFIRQKVSPTKKRRKSIHDIALHYTNGVPHIIDPQNPIPPTGIQQVHQMQQMLPLNPPNRMTQSAFEYSGIANQQVHEMQQLNPQNSMTHQMRAYQQVLEMQRNQELLNSSNNMTHQISELKNSDIAYQQMLLNPPNSMAHQMSGFDSVYQQVHEMQQILPVDPSNSTARQPSGFIYCDKSCCKY